LPGIALALIAAACAFIPQRNPRLDEARREYQEAVADPEVARFAATELRQAAELLEQASLARESAKLRAKGP
jgi:hypothetical protein